MRSQRNKADGSATRGKARAPRGRTEEGGHGKEGDRGEEAKAGVADRAPRERPRLKRTPAARTGPLRDASMMFRSAPFSAPPSAEAPSRRAPKPDSQGGMKGAVEHSVEMAYRVIDDLLQRGRRAAGRAHHPSNKADPVRTNVPNNLASMMMQTWMDMGRMWFGMMGPLLFQTAASGFQQGAGFGGMFPREQQHGTATNAEGRVKVTLDLRSDRPTEVMIDLNRIAATGKKLSVMPLQSKDAGKPSIAGIDIAQHPDGSIRLSVNVPVGQPHGNYNGGIVADDGSPIGAVTVRLHQVHGAEQPSA